MVFAEGSALLGEEALSFQIVATYLRTVIKTVLLDSDIVTGTAVVANAKLIVTEKVRLGATSRANNIMLKLGRITVSLTGAIYFVVAKDYPE